MGASLLSLITRVDLLNFASWGVGFGIGDLDSVGRALALDDFGPAGRALDDFDPAPD